MGFRLRLFAAVGIALGSGGLAACPAVGPQASYPPAEDYGYEIRFAGQWLGEIGGTAGILEVTSLNEKRDRFYGKFRSDDGAVLYSLDMRPEPVSTGAASNLVKFTWQDGRGDLGLGWLLINREDSALTGSMGRGEDRTTGLAELTFIRLE